MKLICQGLDLSDAVLKVSKAIASKNINSILEGIKLVARDDKLILFATDTELAIEKTINAEVLIEGEVIVHGKFFAELVRMLVNEQVEISVDDKFKMKIKYTDGEVEKQCFAPEEYPDFEIGGEEKSFNIVSREFKDLINKTIFCVSTDDGRPALKGCLFEAEEHQLTVVALDGYRLALVNKALESSAEKMSFIAPARSLIELSKFLAEDDSIINVQIKDNFMQVKLEDSVLSTRLLSGEFINYKQIIPSEFETNVIINKDQFKSSLDRASILSRGERNNLVKIEVKENILCIVSSSDDGGSLKETVSINLKGKDMTIAFNARYILDVLKSASDEFIKINLNTPVTPCIITACDREEYTYLILPVRIF